MLIYMLQVFKLESGAEAEGPVSVSSDKDAEQGSVGKSDEKQKAEEWRHGTLQDFPGIRRTGRASRSESCCLVKLLFSHINSALLKINQRYSDPHPWLMPTMTFSFRWFKNELGDGIHELLAYLGKKPSKDAAEKSMMIGTTWLNLWRF